MKIIEQKTAYISSAFICAIEYGDYTGLEEEEKQLLFDFLDDYIDKNIAIDYEQESRFCCDSITGLMSDCYEATINIFE